jgi:hypothetical protein
MAFTDSRRAAARSPLDKAGDQVMKYGNPAKLGSSVPVGAGRNCVAISERRSAAEALEQEALSPEAEPTPASDHQVVHQINSDCPE